MKSYNHLFEKAISDEIMDAALDAAVKDKTYRPNVIKILNNRIKIKEQLRQKLIDGALTPLIHKATVRSDGPTRKKRIIVEPFFDEENPEQWIHHIIILTIQDIIFKGMYEFTCGSIPGRGPHYGKKHLEKFISKNKNSSELKYVLKFDIHHFYESINTDLLKKLFSKVIHDEKMLNLINYVIDSNEYILNGKHFKSGVIIGFYTSQWFANYFLQSFDHYVKEQLKVKCYVRYMDDIVIFGSNKRELHRKFQLIKDYLEGIDLQIKSNYQIFKFDYINKKGKRIGRFVDFMGFKFYRDKTTIRKSTFSTAVKTARKVGKKTQPTWFDAARIFSYVGWFRHTNTYMAFQKYIVKNVNFKTLRKLIRNYSKRRTNGRKLEKGREPCKTR